MEHKGLLSNSPEQCLVSSTDGSCEQSWDVASTAFIPEALRAAVTYIRQPERIGHYHIVRTLGQGGMGVVYEAEQDRPRRTVALKVIKPGFASPNLLRRFELEAEALGRLQHPGIAQIFEAGMADSGYGLQPYFAMEFIRGEPLLQYAEGQKLNVEQRLELMAKICESVHHAHQRGIIHRDLKPANILVEASGQPRVLDFGVARIAEGEADLTRQTDFGQIIGTLPYMSPEQLMGDPLDVDTRSDVYSLGVVLFELLAGCLPYTSPRQAHEALGTIRDCNPTRLGSVNRAYRGDIETIVGKSLEKEKTRRYASAAEMAGDIRRYLRSEPIIARPPSTVYQLGKLGRRHKGSVVGIAAVFLVLAAGVIASTREAMRARAAERTAIVERNRADTESATAKAINDFLRDDVLAQASSKSQAKPGTDPDPGLTVRTALDRAAKRIANKFDKQPLVEASIRETVANSYADLGLYPDAQRQVERALELRRRGLGATHPDTLASMKQLARFVLAQGNYGQAEVLYGRILQIQLQELGAEDARRLTTMQELGYLYVNEGKYAAAENLFTRILEVRRRTLSADHTLILASLESLAFLYLDEGEYARAEPLYAEVVQGVRRRSGDQHPDTLNGEINLATVYRHEGKYTEAEQMLTRALELQRRVLGPEHLSTLNGMRNLAGLYRDEGKYESAERLATKALEAGTRLVGVGHHLTLLIMEELALIYRDERKYAQAEMLYTKLLKLEEQALGREHPRRLASMNDFAFVYLARREYVKAEHVALAALDAYKSVGTDTWHRYESEFLLGASLAGQNRYIEAQPVLLSGYAGMMRRDAKVPAGSQFKLKDAGAWIVRFYESSNHKEAAREWRQTLQIARFPSGVQ